MSDKKDIKVVVGCLVRDYGLKEVLRGLQFICEMEEDQWTTENRPVEVEDWRVAAIKIKQLRDELVGRKMRLS